MKEVRELERFWMGMNCWVVSQLSEFLRFKFERNFQKTKQVFSDVIYVQTQGDVMQWNPSQSLPFLPAKIFVKNFATHDLSPCLLLMVNGGNLSVERTKTNSINGRKIHEVERERKKIVKRPCLNASYFFIFVRLIHHSLASDNVQKSLARKEENTSLTTAPFSWSTDK